VSYQSVARTIGVVSHMTDPHPLQLLLPASALTLLKMPAAAAPIRDVLALLNKLHRLRYISRHTDLKHLPADEAAAGQILQPKPHTAVDNQITDRAYEAAEITTVNALPSTADPHKAITANNATYLWRGCCCNLASMKGLSLPRMKLQTHCNGPRLPGCEMQLPDHRPAYEPA